MNSIVFNKTTKGDKDLVLEEVQNLTKTYQTLVNVSSSKTVRKVTKTFQVAMEIVFEPFKYQKLAFSSAHLAFPLSLSSLKDLLFR